jgi:hypothetical protein
MAGALDVVNVARSQIGFVEGANNENPYGLWYGIPNASYCAMGVSWCFAQVGLSQIIAAQTPKGFAYCPAGLTWFQRQGLVVNKLQAQPGDLVFFSFAGNGVADHIEIVEAANVQGITTIGFNTSPDHINASQSNGGGCYRRHRNYLYVLAIARPKYPVIAKPSTALSASKKTTAVVAATGTAIGGGVAVTHQSVVPTPSPVVFVAPPFPTNPNSFIIGAKNNAVFTVEKGLVKIKLLAKATDTMDAATIAALKKFEASNPSLGAKNGAVNQIVYDVLKAKL